MTIGVPLDPPAPDLALSALTTLNRREREVLTLLAAGKCNKAIAEHLGVAESTVKFHVAGVLKKLGVSMRSEAAVIGVRAGLMTEPTSSSQAGRCGVRRWR
ncbi:LuxR C-terminal-related transcriptional regulator [Nocardia sp. NPDC050408]|uniref:helix-turn-helix domain-containing protein n=1 Tax=Nocardia sp. NPDC050408 TaxID=3364319 RepID=UPI0037BB354B